MSLKSKVFDSPVGSLLIVCVTCFAFIGCTAEEFADFNAELDKIQDQVDQELVKFQKVVDKTVADSKAIQDEIDSFQKWGERLVVSGGSLSLLGGGLGVNSLRKKRNGADAPPKDSTS